MNAVNVKKRAQQVAGFSYDCVSVPSGFGQNWMSTQVPFGDFVLDLDSRELRRGGQPLRLSPKALQLLEILATGRPKAFSKAELQDRLWPGTFVVEKNLANLVAEIREALGDNPSDQRFIRTVPRYGYAFRDQTPAAAPVIAGPPPKARPSALAVGAGLLCVVAAIASFWWIAGRTASTATIIRLAVLPLENLTGDPEQDYLCDGVTEELIAQLGAADPDALKVIARSSAMHYRNTTKRADEIGRELDVQYLLETSLRRVGNRVRVTAQLVSTDTRGSRLVRTVRTSLQRRPRPAATGCRGRRASRDGQPWRGH